MDTTSPFSSWRTSVFVMVTPATLSYLAMGPASVRFIAAQSGIQNCKHIWQELSKVNLDDIIYHCITLHVAIFSVAVLHLLINLQDDHHQFSLTLASQSCPCLSSTFCSITMSLSSFSSAQTSRVMLVLLWPCVSLPAIFSFLSSVCSLPQPVSVGGKAAKECKPPELSLEKVSSSVLHVYTLAVFMWIKKDTTTDVFDGKFRKDL